MYVNGQLWLTGSGKDNVIGEIVRMNLGGSWNGDVDYYGDVAAFRIWDAALTAPTLAAYMNVSSMDALLDTPARRQLARGHQHAMVKTAKPPTKAPWRVGCTAMPDAECSRPVRPFLDAVPWRTHRPALILEGGAEPLMAVGRSHVGGRDSGASHVGHDLGSGRQRRGLDRLALRLACRFGHGHHHGVGRHLVHVTRVGGRLLWTTTTRKPQLLV